MTPEFYRAMADSLERESPDPLDHDPAVNEAYFRASLLAARYWDAIYGLRRLADKLDEYAAKEEKDETVR